MAKLILKVNYYKPGRAKSMGGYAKYIATRENVEKIEDRSLTLKSTESQDELIEKLVKDFPESIFSEEYLSYQEAPNRANASEYITRTLEDNLPYIVDSPTYADYIATRPRAERIGSHGLFTSGYEPVVLSKVSQELNEHQGNVWTFIASLKREDAERLGYDNASRWKDMIGSHVAQMASAMKIPIENLKWYGAFHEKYKKQSSKEEDEIPSNSYPYEQTEHEQNYPASEKNARRPQDVKIHRADVAEYNS